MTRYLLNNGATFIFKPSGCTEIISRETSKQRRGAMLKEAGGLVGGVLIFSPAGVPILLHGVAGVLVGGGQGFLWQMLF